MTFTVRSELIAEEKFPLCFLSLITRSQSLEYILEWRFSYKGKKICGFQGILEQGLWESPVDKIFKNIKGKGIDLKYQHLISEV